MADAPGRLRGDRSRRSSSPPSNGWIGSTTGGSWSPSATSRRPKPRRATTPYWKSQLWRRDSNQTASGKPGAVQLGSDDDWLVYLTGASCASATGCGHDADMVLKAI